MKTNFIGTGVAVITPFCEDKSVDFIALGKLVNRLIEGGVDYLVIMGTTGESATLSQSEKDQVLEFVKKETAGRVPIMYGIGGNDTAEVIEKVKTANLTGVDGILCVAPYYNKPNQEGLYQHFAAIAIACPVQLIMYNIPGRTGINMLPDLVVRLANDFENITAIKEACGSVDQIMQVIKKKPADFTVISGDDGLTLPLLSVGAEGVISVVANAFPKETSDMVNMGLKGEFAKAAKIHYKLLDTVANMFAEGSPGGVKSYLSQMGIIENELRLPMVPASDKLSEKIGADLKNYSL